MGQVEDLDRLVEVLGCQKGALPFIYLGLPLGALYKNKTVWNLVLNNIHKRLAGSWFKKSSNSESDQPIRFGIGELTEANLGSELANSVKNWSNRQI